MPWGNRLLVHYPQSWAIPLVVLAGLVCVVALVFGLPVETGYAARRLAGGADLAPRPSRSWLALVSSSGALS